MLTRREVGGAVALGLLALADAGRAGAKGRDLVEEATDLGRRLAAGELTAVEWQARVAALFRGVDAADLAAALGVDEILRGARMAARGATVVPVPRALRKGAAVKLFAFEAGRANPPHAHAHMVSVHLVLRGRFRVRHFDRVADEPGHVRVRPTIDRVLGPGDLTSISDARDNVHWHVAETAGVLLDVVQAGLDARHPTTTQLLDIDAATRTADGLLRAPRIASVEDALARYG